MSEKTSIVKLGYPSEILDSFWGLAPMNWPKKAFEGFKESERKLVEKSEDLERMLLSSEKIREEQSTKLYELENFGTKLLEPTEEDLKSHGFTENRWRQQSLLFEFRIGPRARIEYYEGEWGLRDCFIQNFYPTSWNDVEIMKRLLTETR